MNMLRTEMKNYSVYNVLESIITVIVKTKIH